MPAAVGQHHLLADSQPPNDGSVVPLGPIEDDMTAPADEIRGRARGRRRGGSPAVERVLEPREEALLPGRELTGRLLFVAKLGQLGQQLAAARSSSWVGVSTETWTMTSPRPPPRSCGTPWPSSGNLLTRLRAGADVDLGVDAVEQLERNARTERGCGHRDVHRAVQVVAAAGEERMVENQHLEVEVARLRRRRTRPRLRR